MSNNEFVRRRKRQRDDTEIDIAYDDVGLETVGSNVEEREGVDTAPVEQEATAGISEHDASTLTSTFLRPLDQFPQWDAIVQAVSLGYLDLLKREQITSDEVTEAMFSQLVSQTVLHDTAFVVPPAELANLVELLRRKFFGLGELEPLMKIPGLEEITCNRYNEVFYTVGGVTKRLEPSPFGSEEELQQFLNMIFAKQGREINLSNQMEDGRLDDGSRIAAAFPPFAFRGACFSIRKFNPKPFTMEQYLETDMFTAEFLDFLQHAINANMTILVSGGTSSGKALPLDTAVVVPGGTTTIGELQLGDTVIGGSSNQPQQVTGVYPQGKKPAWELVGVRENETISLVCCHEHLWPVNAEGGEQVVLSTIQIAEQLGSDAELTIPAPSGVPWTVQSVQPLGYQQEMVCISVDDPQQLFIIEDNDQQIVTHNTTFLNAIAALIPRKDRVVIIENTKELQFETDNYIYLEAQQRGSDSTSRTGNARKSLTIKDGVYFSLRMTPDRIIIGEVRGHEAQDLLQALNTGHDGSFTTMHANSCRDAIGRLEELARSAGELDQETVRGSIARNIDIVIQVGRFRGTPYRKVLEVMQVIHPYQLDTIGRQQVQNIKKKGDLQLIRDPIYTVPLFSRDERGHLIKHNEMVSIINKQDNITEMLEAEPAQAASSEDTISLEEPSATVVPGVDEHPALPAVDDTLTTDE